MRYAKKKIFGCHTLPVHEVVPVEGVVVAAGVVVGVDLKHLNHTCGNIHVLVRQKHFLCDL